MIAARDALSGPWAANRTGWLWTLLPSTLLVVAHEVDSDVTAPGWIALSALLQVLGSALIGALVAGVARRLTGRVPPVASALLWTALGVGRGAIGAAVAVLAGVDPDWGARILFWIAVSWTWMPLLSYSFAQWDERRRLLGLRRAVDGALATVEERHREDAAVRSARIAEAADDALRPALDEIRSALSDPGATLDEETVESLRSRLDDLAARAAVFEPLRDHPEPERARPVTLTEASADFEIRRPILAASLTAVLTAPFLLPGAFRHGGWPAVGETTLAVAGAAVAFAVCLVLLRRLPETSKLRLVLGRVGGLFAGGVGTVLLITLPWQPLDGARVAYALVLPVLLSTAASVLATALAIAETNRSLEEGVRRAEARLTLRRRQLARADELASERVVTLIRGELNGRLASCALALAMLAGGSLGADRRAGILAEVRSQLDAAASELGLA
jgi:hypothetical protein